MTRGELIVSLGGKIDECDAENDEVIVRHKDWSEYDITDTGFEAGNCVIYIVDREG